MIELIAIFLESKYATKNIVIPGELAIASATRNPVNSNASGYRLPPV
jgi:hypothetical protein